MCDFTQRQTGPPANAGLTGSTIPTGARNRPRREPLLFCCLLAFLFGAVASPARSAPPEPRAVTVGIPQSFPPYYSLDADGNPVGFAVLPSISFRLL